jgi:hypothetical protein
VATVAKGIVIYDPGAQKAFQPFAESDNPEPEVSYANFFLYCDKDSITWTSYWMQKGIYELLPYSKSVKRYTADSTNPFSLTDNSIVNLTPADRGHLWIGSGEGVIDFDPQKEAFQLLYKKNIPGIINMLGVISVDTVTRCAIVRGDNWRIYHLDTRTKKCTEIIFEDSTNEIIYPGSPDAATPFKNNVFIAAHYSNHFGIFIINSSSNIAHQILCFPKNLFDNVFEDDEALACDGNNLYLKTNQAKYNITCTNKNGKWIQTSSALDTISWDQFYFNDLDQTYWIVYGKKLIHFNKSFEVLQTFTKKNGLPESDIQRGVTDKYGNFWFNTDRSIYRVDVNTGMILELSGKDGFQKQRFDMEGDAVVLKLGVSRSINGDIYFAGGLNGKGFDRIKPDKFQISYPPAKVYLESVQINEKPFTLSTGVNDLQTLSLKYFQNNIAIETGIIDYYSKGTSSIRYKLKEINEEWHHNPAGYYSIRYDGLASGNYTLLVQASNVANQFNGSTKTLLIHINPPFWDTWWFRTIVAICIIAVIYVLIRWRVRQKFQLQLDRSEKEKQLAENAKQLAELQQQKTEVEMQALRAQMNPHFIFNCLNSINRFILTNETEAAANYLTKFSRLVRMVLSNSEEAFIPLEDELMSLRLYIDLEQLRFKNAFEYVIKIGNNVNPATIAIPPLLLQPFVENAIWHGLMNKGSDGKLEISIDLVNDFLCCTIADNGIGRTKAFTIKSKSAEKNKSMGLQITKNRMALLNSNSDEHNFTINDLIDENGNAKGTSVFIKIKCKELQDEFE